MIGIYLLDTNVISEQIKPFPNPNVIKMLNRKESMSAIPSVAWAECLFGIKRMPESRKKNIYSDYYINTVLNTFSFIPFEEHAASIFSDIKSRLERIGKPASLLDMQIAATAIANNLILVTRNVKDFEAIADFSALMLENWFD